MSIHASMSNTQNVLRQHIAVFGKRKFVAERRWFVGQFLPRIKGKLSRPLTGTANWIIVRGNARPVVAVANRIDHPRPFTPTAVYSADGLRGKWFM
jgi:hypothetical protein